MTSRNIAVVCQRYGHEIVGGAERHAALLAERLATHFGQKVTVFTTCALDSHSWENHYEPGQSMENDVRVIRFPVESGRKRWIMKILLVLLRILPRKSHWLGLRLKLEDLWIRAQGPIAPQLIQDLVAQSSQFDCIFAFTYLFWPTISIIQALPNKIILIPTAHKEEPFFFERVQMIMRQSRLLATNSAAEEKLILEQDPSLQPKLRRVGIAIEAWPTWPNRPKEIPTDRPYFLVCGRIDQSKSVHELITAFLKAITDVKPDLQPNLVLMGTVSKHFEIPNHPRIVATGPVPLYTKQAAIDHCLCIVNPSKHESLSLLVLEGLLAQKPCLVNAESEVLADYASQVETVIGFLGFQECAELMTKISVGKLTFSDAQRESAREWAKREHGNEAVDQRIRDLLNSANSPESKSSGYRFLSLEGLFFR